MPALRWAYLAAIMAISLYRPELLLLPVWPGVFYVPLLLMSGLHASIQLKSIWPIWLVPAYALLLHLGYGLGYLVAWGKMLWPFSRSRCSDAIQCLVTCVRGGTTSTDFGLKLQRRDRVIAHLCSSYLRFDHCLPVPLLPASSVIACRFTYCLGTYFSSTLICLLQLLLVGSLIACQGQLMIT